MERGEDVQDIADNSAREVHEETLPKRKYSQQQNIFFLKHLNEIPPQSPELGESYRNQIE